MIVCGYNDNDQLFISRRYNDYHKNTVYPPEEVQRCQGFTFCVTGNLSSSAFFDIEPPNLSNKKIIEEKLIKVKSKDENKERESTKKFESYKQKYSEKEEIQNLKKEILNLQKVNSTLQEENSELKTRNKKI